MNASYHNMIWNSPAGSKFDSIIAAGGPGQVEEMQSVLTLP